MSRANPSYFRCNAECYAAGFYPYLIDKHLPGDLLDFDRPPNSRSIDAIDERALWISDKRVLIGAWFDGSDAVHLDTRLLFARCLPVHRESLLEHYRFLWSVLKYDKMFWHLSPRDPLVSEFLRDRGPLPPYIESVTLHMKDQSPLEGYFSVEISAEEPVRAIVFDFGFRDYGRALRYIYGALCRAVSMPRFVYLITPGFPFTVPAVVWGEPNLVEIGSFTGYRKDGKILSVQTRNRSFPYVDGCENYSITKHGDENYLVSFSLHLPLEERIPATNKAIETLERLYASRRNGVVEALKFSNLEDVPRGKAPISRAPDVKFETLEHPEWKMRLCYNTMLRDVATCFFQAGFPFYVVLWLTEWLHPDVDMIPELRRVRHFQHLYDCVKLVKIEADKAREFEREFENYSESERAARMREIEREIDDYSESARASSSTVPTGSD